MTDRAMETAVLRYVVTPAHLAEHLAMLRDVYAALGTLAPHSFGWATYRLRGSNEFIEVATGGPLPGPLPSLPEFQRYRAGLEARCESRRFDQVTVIGAYRSLD